MFQKRAGNPASYFLLLHEFHESCHFVNSISWKQESNWICDTKTPQLDHTKDERKYNYVFLSHLWCELFNMLNVTEWHVSWLHDLYNYKNIWCSKHFWTIGRKYKTTSRYIFYHKYLLMRENYSITNFIDSNGNYLSISSNFTV